MSVDVSEGWAHIWKPSARRVRMEKQTRPPKLTARADWARTKPAMTMELVVNFILMSCRGDRLVEFLEVVLWSRLEAW